MTYYKLTGIKSKLELKVGYNAAGVLVSFEFLGDWVENLRVFMLYKFLVNLEFEKPLIDRSPDITAAFRIDKIPADLSFEAFWNAYTHKVGNKERAKKLWGMLEAVEREQALLYIRKYNNWLVQNVSVQKLYPETYLNQKRWENDY